MAYPDLSSKENGLCTKQGGTKFFAIMVWTNEKSYRPFLTYIRLDVI